MTEVARHGLAVEGYDEAPVAAHLKGSEIEIGVYIGLGDGRATVWTCDLTHGYISINADYRSCNESVPRRRSEEHTSELQSVMRNSYAVFCLKKKNKNNT